MKKILLILGIAISMQLTYAQKPLYTEIPDRLFNQGKEMFLDNNYVGTIHTLNEFKKISKDDKLIEEADYMIVSSLYNQGKSGAEIRLKEYIEKYPSSYHRNQIAFYIGSSHFRDKEWGKATFWLSQADIDYLSMSDQEDHSYRLAYSYLQLGDIGNAKRLFGLLTRNSKKYDEPAAYYMAYINFNEKQYRQALPVFSKLKDKPQYKENATFFLIQGAYVEQNLSEVTEEGERYVSIFPNGDNTTEVYRLLGNSYYRLGDTRKSISNYENHIKKEPKPQREDMYQLAEAYYRTNNYGQAVNTLKKLASSTDQLGQAGNMLLGQSYLKLNDAPNALMAFDAAARSNHSPAISEEASYNYVMLVSKGSAVTAFGESITALQNFLTKYPHSKYTNEINKTLATTLLSVKNYQMALNAIDKIQLPDKQILEAKQIILYQLGVQEFLDRQYNSAIQRFDTAILMGNHDMNAKIESYFWRADSHYRNGNFEAAATDYTTYVKSANSSQANYAMAYYNLGYANFQTKGYNAALANFRQYLSNEKDTKSITYPDALNRMGDCYLFNRNFSEAEKVYAQAVNSDPSNADYSEFQKAFVLGLQRNYSGKVVALDNMMRKYPQSPYFENALFEKSRALVMLNKEKEAIAVLEDLFKGYPKTGLAAKAGVQLGQLYFNINNPQKSIAAYKQVIGAYPNTDEARVAINSMEGVYKDINDISSYATYLNSLGKGNVLSATRQDSLTYLAAENVYMKDKKGDAKTSFSNYLKSYPNGVFAGDANYFLGNMAFEAKEYTNALSHFKEVIHSNNAKYIDDALIFASGIEFEHKDYESAYSTYEQLSTSAINSDNRDVGELGMLRCAYLTNKDKEVLAAAEKLLRNAKLSSDVANETLFYKGRSENRLGMKDEAITDLKVVAGNTRTAFGAESQYILADIYYHMGKYDEVEKQVLSFMKAGTSHEYWMAKSIIVLSDAYRDKGDKFQARQYLESLQANYKGGDKDIETLVAERLAQLGNQ